MSEVLRWDVVKNRKPHKCRLCGRIIPTGQQMIVAAWADDGTVFRERFCPVYEEYWRSELGGGEISFDDTIYGSDFEAWDAIRKRMEATDHA